MFYFAGSRKPDFRRSKKINYDDYWRDRGFEMRSKLMEREHIFFDWIKDGSKVLDIGCGTSRLLFELKNKKHCEVTGVDISPLVIESLKKAGINLDRKVLADLAVRDEAAFKALAEQAKAKLVACRPSHQAFW